MLPKMGVCTNRRTQILRFSIVSPFFVVSDPSSSAQICLLRVFPLIFGVEELLGPRIWVVQHGLKVKTSYNCIIIAQGEWIPIFFTFTTIRQGLGSTGGPTKESRGSPARDDDRRALLWSPRVERNPQHVGVSSCATLAIDLVRCSSFKWLR